MLKELTYEQWLFVNPDIAEDKETGFCPECFGQEGDRDCSICGGDGVVSLTRLAYEEKRIADRKALKAYNESMGLKQCRCGRWVKTLMRMRWSDAELCQVCFEQLASEVRKEASEHDYDRHYRWGQGL